MRAERRKKRKTAIEMGGLCEGRFEGMGIGVERNKGSGGGWVEENTRDQLWKEMGKHRGPVSVLARQRGE